MLEEELLLELLLLLLLLLLGEAGGGVGGGMAAPLLQFLVLGDTPTLEAVLRITTLKSRPLYP